jgi:hypothetical protein
MNVRTVIESFWKQTKLFSTFNFGLDVHVRQNMFLTVFSAMTFGRSLALLETFVSNFPDGKQIFVNNNVRKLFFLFITFFSQIV